MLKKYADNKLVFILVFSLGLILSTAPYVKIVVPIYYFFLLISILTLFKNFKNIFNFYNFELVFYFFLLFSIIFLILKKDNFSFDIHFAKTVFTILTFLIFFKLIDYKIFLIFVISFIFGALFNSIIALLQVKAIQNMGFTFFFDLRFLLKFPINEQLKNLEMVKNFYLTSPSGLSYTNIQMSYQLSLAFFLLKYLNYINFFKQFKKTNFFIHLIFYLNIVLNGLTVLVLFIFFDLFFYLKNKNLNKLIKIFLFLLIIASSIFCFFNLKIDKKLMKRISLWNIGIQTMLLKEENSNKGYFELREDVFKLNNLNDSQAKYYRERGPHNSIIVSSREVGIGYLIFQIFFHLITLILISKNLSFDKKLVSSSFIIFLNTMFHSSGLPNYDIFIIILMNSIFLITNHDKKKLSY